MTSSFIFNLFLALILFPATYAKAETLTLEKSGYTFRLETDVTEKKVELYTLGSPEPLPDQLTLKLYSGEGQIEQIALRLVKPTDATGRPMYAGAIQMAPRSVVSMGLQFKIGKKKRPTDLKWVDIGFKK